MGRQMTVRILIGDALARLRELPDESVHCCVTSPPYCGLRDYGTARWEGGDAACDHLMPMGGGTKASGLAKYANGLDDETIAAKVEQRRKQYPGECKRCGAVRRDEQIGLEPTPEAYVARMVEVFAEVRRVLRPDGTLWLNLGDSYARSPSRGVKFQSGGSTYLTNRQADEGNRGPAIPPGPKEKDLVGIPWRVAFALQDDGWWLRSDIIWHKPNPMPESVTDRPTKSHEYVFLLTKSARYFYDAAAIREPDAGTDHARTVLDGPSLEPSGGLKSRHKGIRTTEGRNGQGRNIRTVWPITTRPFPGSHFATMPPALAERCILAGCPVGGTVLDPFGGAGTTGLVADRLQRDAVLIELNPAYAEMARERIKGAAPMFADVELERGAA